MQVKIDAGGRLSTSALLLAKALGVMRLRRPTSFRPRAGDVVINWGAAELPGPHRTLNNAAAVSRAIDKIATFRALTDAGVPCVEWTTDQRVASQWPVVVVRHHTRGSKGSGIEIIERGTQLPRAPLYTKYFPRRHEFRVHVLNGEVIDVQEKRRRAGTPRTHYSIRQTEQGWVYCRTDVRISDVTRNIAISSVRALGLDFGAVDLGVRGSGETRVFEINTAPGIEGTTVDNYAAAFRRLFNWR
jgi:glutathione synthase/RimK-type ligase-like ATP-grasp enzyme